MTDQGGAVVFIAVIELSSRVQEDSGELLPEATEYVRRASQATTDYSVLQSLLGETKKTKNENSTVGGGLIARSRSNDRDRKGVIGAGNSKRRHGEEGAGWVCVTQERDDE
jgi:hypothetical protein